MKSTKVSIVLKGVRPLMFDRYPGDNNTQLRPEEKFYLNEKNQLFLPSINLYSMLISENGKSAAKQYCGKAWRTVSQCIASSTDISPFEIPISENGKQIVFKEFGEKLFVHSAVARVKKGNLSIPSPKARPAIKTPWEISFEMILEESKDLTFETLRNLFKHSENIGLGTFRPFFGRFVVEKFEIIK